MHPRTVAFDALLAVALAATMVVELWRSDEPDTRITLLSVAVIALASAPVLLRRTRPGLALVLAMAGLYAVMATVEIYQTVPFPSMVAGYSLALVSSRRTTILAGLALVPFVVAAIAIFGHEVITTAELPKNLAFVAAPLLLGSAVRERRAAHDALVERAETAERTREEEALRRVGEERLRIARDVHDVVAHAMVAINVQAGVGAHLLDRDPEQARRTLQDIKKLSGEALDDLRATLGTLRAPEDDEAAPVRPAPGLRELDDLGELGESLRSAGVEVEVDVDPATRTLPAVGDHDRLPDRAGGAHQRGPARQRLAGPGAGHAGRRTGSSSTYRTTVAASYRSARRPRPAPAAASVACASGRWPPAGPSRPGRWTAAAGGCWRRCRSGRSGPRDDPGAAGRRPDAGARGLQGAAGVGGRHRGRR